MKTFIGIIILASLTSAIFGAVLQVNPESLEVALAELDSDSTLAVRARLAYARGLYHSAKDLAERISSPTQADILLLGQCCHVLAQPHAARGYFSRVTDPGHLPIALLGLAELYCLYIPDADSCERYIDIVDGMGYLSRFVMLDMPVGDVEIEIEPEEVHLGAWTLQFGAFQMETLAQQLAVKVRKEGLRTWIVPVEVEEITMFYVFGGEFATKGEAAAQADALAREFECRVVEMPE